MIDEDGASGLNKKPQLLTMSPRTDHHILLEEADC